MNYRYGLLLSAMLVALLLVGSASAPVVPDVPSPPYIPKSPAEDIVKVEAWIEQPHNQLKLKVTFAAESPPTGQSIQIFCTILGSTETVLNLWIYDNPPSSPRTTWGTLVSGLDDPNTPIAVYAILGTLSTDRAPNSGFYQVTATSESAPNDFYDPEGAVGGVVMPTNTLAILSPYLALAGLAAVVSTVVLVKRRRD